MRTNGFAIPGTVDRPAQPSMFMERLEREILVSKVWEWVVWCSAIWWVRCHARGKGDCESVMMLFCASKGDEREGWKERERR